MAEFVYCLNTSTIRPTPLLEKIRIAGAAGYRAIEPWNVEVDAYLRQGGSIPELRTALNEAGLRVVSVIALGGWITAEGDERAGVLEECRRRMEQARELGSPFIVASPPQEVVDLRAAAARFGELIELGRSVGVIPSMEFLGFVDGVNTLRAAQEIAEGSAQPEATIVADVFHLIRGGGSIDDLLDIPGDRLSIFHINDIPSHPDPRIQSDADRVLPGDGIADLGRVVANLRTIGYRGPLSLELFNPTLWDQDPYEVARRGLDRVRLIVET